MPVVENIRLSLKWHEAEKIPGLKCRGLMHKRVRVILPEIMAEIEEDNLLHPAIAYAIAVVKNKIGGMITLEDGTRLHAPILTHRMGRASELVFGVVTIGSSIAVKIDSLFKKGKQFKAVLMEEIANAYLYKLSMRLQEIVDSEATARFLQSSGTLSPGDEGFDLGQQDRVLALADAASINVSLSESFMMTPRHSVSNVIGLGQHMRKWTQLENCSECAARERCPHRQTVEALSG